MPNKHRQPDDKGDFSVDLGTTFDGHQILRSDVASGGSGVIHEAVDPQGRRCALKILHRDCILKDLVTHFKEMGHDDTAAAKEADNHYVRYITFFKNEYRRLVGISHPNVAEAYNLGFSQGHFYFTSEFIEGVTLAEYTDRMEPVKMIPLFVQVLEGLDFIHRAGLIHLDIKSENVLVQEVDGKPVVKLIDFGLTMPIEDYGGESYGSYHYMAPEVAFGKKKQVDTRADLFSFGVLMFFCLSWGIGYPFQRTSKKDPAALRRCIERETLTELPSSIHVRRPGTYPLFYDDILNLLLAKNPEDRFYSNARAVINALLTKSPGSFGNSVETKAAYLIPESNRHIGREKEQEKIYASLDGLEKGLQPPVFVIEGKSGLGKSHLLKKIKDLASERAESIAVSSIQLPSDALNSRYWVDSLFKSLTEGSRPVVILVDDVHVLKGALSSKQNSESNTDIQQVLKKTVKRISERLEKPRLYETLPPVFLCISLDNTVCSVADLKKLLKVESDYVDIMELKPFSEAQTRAYLAATPALKNVEIQPERIKQLQNSTSGIPAELKERLEEIDSRGILFDLEGNLLLASLPPAGTKEIPFTTETRLTSVIDNCDEGERQILELMAVWCRHGLADRISFDDINHFLPLPSLRQRIDILMVKGLLLEKDNGDFAFKNDEYLPSLIYDKAENTTLFRLHEEAAEYLENNRRDRDLILFHRSYTLPSPRSLRSISLLTKKKLFVDGDLDIARALCEYAITSLVGDSDKLFAYFSLLLSSVCLHEGRYEDAAIVVNKALSRLYKVDYCWIWHFNLLINLTNIHLRLRNFTDAKNILGTAVRLLHSNNSKNAFARLQIDVLNTAARTLYEHALTDPEWTHALLLSSKNTFERSLNLETSLPSSLQDNIVNNDIGLVLIALGQYDQAIDSLHVQLERYKRRKYHFGILHSTISLSSAYRFVGNYERAVSLADEVIELAKHHYQGKWLIYAHQNLAYIMHDTNRFDMALAEDDRWLAASNFLNDSNEHRKTQISVWNHKGHNYKEIKNWQRAIMYFEAALDLEPDLRDKMYSYEGLGEAYFYMGDLDKSEEHLRIAYELLNKLSPQLANSYRFPIGRFLAEVMLRKGNTSVAGSILSDIEFLADRNDDWQKQYSMLKSKLDTAIVPSE